MTNEWEPINDSLQELEAKGLTQHRGAKALPAEVKQAQETRNKLETTIGHIKKAMLQESFKIVQKGLKYIVSKDPVDETHLQASLEVLDPYTELNIKGVQELETLIKEKLTIIDQLKQWQAGYNSPVNWPRAYARVMEYSRRGDFDNAIQLAAAALGQQGNSHGLLEAGEWSIKQARDYLESSPISADQINSNCRQNYI